MRENRLHGSEGGVAKAIPTPIRDGSIRSAAMGLDPTVLFADFSATTAGSDFSRSCIIGYGLIGLPGTDRQHC